MHEQVECDASRMDVRKALDRLGFAMSRARKEVLVVGERPQIEKIGEAWLKMAAQAKEHVVKVADIMAGKE